MSENTSSAADKQDSSSDEDQYNWDSDPGDLSFVHDTSCFKCAGLLNMMLMLELALLWNKYSTP